MDKLHKIEDLIERFFEGMTSNEEEKELYVFFSQDDIPNHLAKFKPVFEYFNEGIAEDAVEKKKTRTLHQEKTSHKRRKQILYTISGIAASILLLLSAHYILNKNTSGFDPYEGSYIVRNGVRITDMDIIRPELEKAYQLAISQQENAELLLQSSQGIKPNVDIENKLQEQYNDLLNRSGNEYAQKEIKEIFESI